MATRTVVCPDCDAPLPYGRLSCPSCGALLASVAGAPGRRRRTTAVAAESTPPATDPDPSPDEVVPVSAPADTDDAAEPAPPEVELPPDGDRPPVEPPAPDAHAAEPPPPEPTAVADRSEPRREPDPDAEVPAPPAWAAPPVLRDWPPAPAGAWPIAVGSSSAGLQSAVATSEMGTGPAHVAALPRMPAGSWLPPTAAFGETVPNGAAPGSALGVAAPATGPTSQGTIRPGRSSLLADLPFDAPNDLAGWLVAVGSGIAVAGFLLPWAERIPFTAGFGYTDRWGFAVASHIVPFAATLALLVLAILPNRLPAWLRSGVLPLAVGGLLLGIVWPYVVGAIGSLIGSMCVAVGAGLLVAGGVVGARPDRHVPHDPAV